MARADRYTAAYNAADDTYAVETARMVRHRGLPTYRSVAVTYHVHADRLSNVVYTMFADTID